MKQNEITILSTLPPIIGLSPYTKGLVEELCKNTKINFLGFKHIYPKFLYPGKLLDESSTSLEEHENLKIRNVLNWFNPIGWIIEAFRIKTDIIHAQWWSYPLAPLYLTILGINKLRGKKIILTIHNVIPHEKSFIKILFNKSIFFLGDEYIVHTQKCKEDLKKFVKNKNIHILPHGLLVNPLKGLTKEEARDILKLDHHDKILLCFGHIRDYKGLDVAIKAISLIKDEKVKLLIAGKCWEKWDKYEAIIKQNNVEGRIIRKTDFIPTEEIEAIFKASDLVLLPYKYFDAQSGVGALVLPFEIPLIVSNTGGLTNYVNDGNCIINVGNFTELANKITKILDNRDLYSKIQQDVREQVKKISWDHIAEQTIQIYANIK